MFENEFIQIISSVGFPIAVTAYLLIRFEKIIEENTKALQSLRDIIRIRTEVA